MPLAASEVMDEAASVYLNDASKIRWPYAVLLPYLKSAWLELQAELESNDLPPLHETSAVLTITPGTVVIPSPSDMVLPLFLYERAVGDKRWTDMDERSWEPDADPQATLDVWVYREGLIQLLGATTTREVRIRYIRSLSTITSENSTIEIGNAKGFLAARTAGLASTFGGRASDRGKAANDRGDYFKTSIISSLTKRMQDRPVRRRRYPFASMRRRFR